MPYSIQDLLFYWEGIGVFDFLLPFFLVFAIVYGILTYVKVFGANRSVHVIVSIVVGLMATRFSFFTQFYSELFPRLGVGLVAIVALLSLIGLFWSKKSETFMPLVLLAVGIAVTIIILYQTFDVLGWTFGVFGGFGGSAAAGWILTAVLIIGVIVAIVVGGQSNSNQTPLEKMVDGFKSMYSG